jgi:hypothetical protein
MKLGRAGHSSAREIRNLRSTKSMLSLYYYYVNICIGEARLGIMVVRPDSLEDELAGC